ncbi:MAG: hypothetical protein KDN22_26700 [Verrucomicrobiae bacterium]|nr:hypothetical protein [Verrucomicrobiae bacterium]
MKMTIQRVITFGVFTGAVVLGMIVTIGARAHYQTAEVNAAAIPEIDLPPASIATGKNGSGANSLPIEFAPQLENTPTAHSIQDLVDLANPPHGNFARLRVRIALEGATKEQLATWLKNGEEALVGPSMSKALKWMLVREALEERMALVDPLTLVKILTAKLEKLPQGSNSGTLSSLARLPTDQVGPVLESLPDRFRFDFVARHLQNMNADNDIHLAAMKDAFLNQHATEEERKSLEELDRVNAKRSYIPSEAIPEDAAAAESLIAELPPSQQGDVWRRFYYRILSGEKGSPEASLEKAERAGIADRDPSVIARFYESVVDQWVYTDPDAAIRWANGLDGELKSGVMKDLLQTMARSDPERAMVQMNTLPAERRDAETMGEIALAVSDFDPKAAVEWMWSQPAEARSRICTIGERWIAQDPVGAAAWLTDHPEALAAEQGADSLVSGYLLNEDPSLAVQLVSELPPSETRSQLASDLTHNLAAADFESALDFVDLMHDDPAARKRGIEGIATFAVEQDSQRTIDWIAGLDASDQNVAIASMISSGRVANPQFIAELASGWLGTTGHEITSEVRAGIQAIGDALAVGSLADAQSWAATLPAGQAQEAAITGIATAWLNSEPAAAAEWIGSLPSGEVKDAAVVQLVAESLSDPGAALAWAAGISSSAKRIEALKRVANDWHTYDPANAAAAINQLNLSHEESAALKEVMQP